MVEIELIFPLKAAFSEIWAIFSNLQYLAMKLGHLPKFQKLHMYSLSTLGGGGGENEVIFALLAAASDIRGEFQYCHIWV